MTPMSVAVTAPLSALALACRRGDRILFSGLNFDIAPGHITWVRGSNGRGKTSLLRLVAGLASPEAGAIHWGAEKLSHRDPAFAQQLLYLAHANALKEDLSAAESLAFLARLHGQADDAASIQTALHTLGIASRRHAPVRTLSQGQRRRVALARLVLAPRKALWLLDEPYDALDAAGCAIVDALLSAHALSGGIVLLTSHLQLTITTPAPVELHLPGDVA